MIGITSYGAYIPWHRIDRKSYLDAFVIPFKRSFLWISVCQPYAPIRMASISDI